MDAELTRTLLRLATRGERLLAALEARHGTAEPPDFSAPALRWRTPGFLEAIHQPHHVSLTQLHGIDAQKEQLLRNTRQFVAGAPANNALLWGARGTGKSSLVKALLPEFADEGLRLVEVEGRLLRDLPRIVAPLVDRPERFIVFTDDLSFNAQDDEYKALKAVLDGAVAALPDNVLIYATSNRRHLLPEFLEDNRQAHNVDGEIHHGEAVEEKISLSERFGLWLSFYPFDQQRYLEIVRSYVQQLAGAGNDLPAAEAAALQWALARGSRSGRVAWQFARDWVGRHAI